MANDKKDDVDINKIYGHLCKMPKEEFCTKFKIKEGGLSDEEITFRRQKYGLNEVTQTKPKKWYKYIRFTNETKIKKIRKKNGKII